MENGIVPKAIISNRIYLDNPGQEETKKIVGSLTYKIKKDTPNPKFSTVETVKNYKVLTKGILSLPQSRQDLIPSDYEVVDKRVLVPVPFPEPKLPLRPDQQEVYDEITDTCIVNALVGWGKSFLALYLAYKFGQKTLVITHTTALRDQWREDVQTLFGCESGIIGSGEFDHENHFITIANVQTLVKHSSSLSKEFGTVIVDECHHIVATTFTTILDGFHARYKVGLSGTLIRKDGKHVLFQDYFGSHILKPALANTLVPQVHLVKSGFILKPGASWVDRITALTQDEVYQRYIAGIALMHMEAGHSVLVVADRVEFLERVQELIGDSCLLVTGDTSFEQRQEAKQQLLRREKQAVCGSRQIFSEGISINVLSCLVLAVPLANDSLLEQLVGRVQRQYEGKLQPLVVDIQFAGYADRSQNNSRLSFYLRKGWQTVTM
jgi:superfamily II DNA or RNA helicase